MGTSKDFGGQENKTPLVPSWLEDEAETDTIQENGNAPQESPDIQDNNQDQLPPLPPTQVGTRFSTPRGNFTKYVK